MKIVFIGASHFGLRCLELICSLPSCEVMGVVTAPQRFSISYQPKGVTNVLFADLASFAKDRGLGCHTIGQSMSDAIMLEIIKAWKPDAFLVAGWYHMIPKKWREIAPAYGLHASLLPDYSGGAPLVWAMINGETRTGITLFQMDDGVDTGPIVGQAEEVIKDRDTIATLYARIEERGLYLLRETLPKLADGTVVLRNQPVVGKRLMPQRNPDSGLIDWMEDNRFIDRFVRAQTKPYPGAYTFFAGERIVIWTACWIGEESSLLTLRVGSIIHQNSKCLVICGKGLLRLDEIEINGEQLIGEDILSRLPHKELFENLRMGAS